MIRPLIHDPLFLAQKSQPATKADKQVASDLLDTLLSHSKECVGMAANMIGVKKRIICFNNNGIYTVMFNPVITKKSGEYKTKEGCLSLLGPPRDCIRYKSITVSYETFNFEKRISTFTGFTAQIIQHETDHLDGILI